MKFSIAMAAMGSILGVSAAFAQAPDHAGLAACRADMQTLCGGEQGKRTSRFQCLVQNRDKVSAACAATLAAIGERGRGNRGTRPGLACRGDVEALCGSAERGAARQQCLRDHQAQLSQACKDALANLMTLRREARAACREDRRSLCGNVEAGAARQKCLRENIARVSPACGAALAQLPGRGAGSRPSALPGQQPPPQQQPVQSPPGAGGAPSTSR